MSLVALSQSCMLHSCFTLCIHRKDGSPSYAAETGFGYIHIKEILDLLKEQKYPGNVIVELYDYSPEHMLEGIGESVSWVAGVLRE